MAMSADIGAGIARGLAETGDYIRDTPNRESRNAQAKLIQSQAQAKMQAGVPQTEANLEVEQLKSQLNQLQMQSLQKDTYAAFDRYTADGDTNHLNKFFQNAKQNPLGAELYSNIARIDPIRDTPEVRAQLGKLGIDNLDDYMAHPELFKSKALITQPDGTQVVSDLNNVMAATGYTDYLGAKKLGQLQQRANIDKILQGPQSAETNLIRKIAEEKGISVTAAAAEYYGMKNKGKGGTSGSAQERIAKQLMDDDPELSEEEALAKAKGLTTSGSALEREARRISEAEGKDFQTVYSELKETSERTNKRKQLDEAKSVRKEIDSIAGGDFLANGAKDETTRRKIGPLITEIEGLTGKSLNTDDKKTARDLRDLFALGSKAGEGLTAAETGFYDNTLKNVKKYFSDDATGTEATSAYSTFVNTLRNTFYGATLTVPEMDAFRSAAGSLKQQLGPVLAGLKTQLSTVQEQMKTIYDMNDEYVAQYYLGTSLEQMNKVMHSIDERVKFFTDLEQEQIIKAKPSTTDKPPKRSLDEIFGAKK